MKGVKRHILTHTYKGQFEKSPDGWIYHTAAGYYDLAAGKHYWYLRDRLGSTVAVLDANGNYQQTTAYYPSGTPYQLPNATLATDVDASTDRLHIGNRWLSHSGLNRYDNTARMHDPVLMHFATPDPLYAKYQDLSPWSHCAANPLNAVDLDGEDYNLIISENYITIQAFIYADSDSYGLAQNSAKLINKQSYKYNYMFQSSVDKIYRTLPVRFDISVIKAPEIETNSFGLKHAISQANAPLASDGRTGKNIFVYGGDYANFGENITGRSHHNGSIVGLSPNPVQTGAHEMGHLLGFIHKLIGLMTSTIDDDNRTNEIAPDNILESILSGLTGKQNTDRNADGTTGNAGIGTLYNESPYKDEDLLNGLIIKRK